MTEEWRPIPSCHGYEVSDLGNVRSLDRVVLTRNGQLRSYKAQMLTPTIGSHGYPMVSLGRKAKRTVHSLVAESFIGPCPEGLEIRHGDGNRTNPKLLNLSYGTRSDNVLDAYRHGTRDKALHQHISETGRKTKAQRYGPNFDKDNAHKTVNTKNKLYGRSWGALGFAGVEYSKKGFDL